MAGLSTALCRQHTCRHPACIAFKLTRLPPVRSLASEEHKEAIQRAAIVKAKRAYRQSSIPASSIASSAHSSGTGISRSSSQVPQPAAYGENEGPNHVGANNFEGSAAKGAQQEAWPVQATTSPYRRRIM